jgi:hypothetical protein
MITLIEPTLWLADWKNTKHSLKIIKNILQESADNINHNNIEHILLLYKKGSYQLGNPYSDTPYFQ